MELFDGVEIDFQNAPLPLVEAVFASSRRLVIDALLGCFLFAMFKVSEDKLVIDSDGAVFIFLQNCEWYDSSSTYSTCTCVNDRRTSRHIADRIQY